VLDHVIAFQADLTPEGEQALWANLERLRAIPEVRELTIGKNVGTRSQGYDYCMRITFDSLADLAIYEDHPVHVEVRAYNRAVTTAHICVDFEFDRV
jgi:hypothetical protein